MEKVVLNCEFITPAFIYGTSTEPELRADSIKGLMRYWWRATYTKSDKIEDMRNEENSIFGGIVKSEDKDVFCKAKLNIAVSCANQQSDTNGQLIKKLNRKNAEGIKYIYYSMIIKNSKKRYFKSEMKFKVAFYYSNKHKEYVYEYLRAFNALQLFGGIGSRNKKGAGDFVVTSIENINDLEISKIKENIYSEEWIKEDTSMDLDYYYSEFLKCNLHNLKYSNIASENCEILKINNIKSENQINDYSNILNKIAELYKEARKSVGIGNGPARGKSPLIIKIIKEEKIFKSLLIRLCGDFNDEKENKVVDKLFAIVRNEFDNIKELK